MMLELRSTQINDAGCATLAAALNRGTLPALEEVMLEGTRARALPLWTQCTMRWANGYSPHGL